MSTRLFQRATVYTENASTGAFDVAAKENLRCRVTHIGGGQTTQQRAEMAELRHLIFDGSYLMPEYSEILIETTRYRPISGTFKTIRGTGGRIKDRACDLIEANT